jgi:translation initiation factor IF-2
VAVRIYTLAKDLKVDSKDLVDLCKKAGITGKGSALASLTDEEAQKVTDYVRGSSSGASQSTPARTPAAATREAVAGPAPIVAAVREPIVVGSPKRSIRTPIAAVRSTRESSPTPASAAEKTAPPRPEPVAEAAPPVAPTAPTPARADVVREREPRESDKASTPSSAPSSRDKAKAPSRPETPAARPLPIPPRPGSFSSRDRSPTESIAPVRRDPVGQSSGGKIRVLGRGGRTPERGPEEGTGAGPKSPQKRRDPVVNLAALPDAVGPAPTRSAPTEAPAQKPDIRLSKDVIAGHKQGVKAPLEQLAQAEDQKKRATRVGSGGLSGFTGDKAKGGKRGAVVDLVDEEDQKRRPGLAGMASARADRGTGKAGKRPGRRNEVEQPFGRPEARRRRTINRKGTNTAAPRKDKVTLELPCTIRSFSEAAGIPVAQVLRVMMGMQMMVNINSQLDYETAGLIATELELDIELSAPETLEDELITSLEDAVDEDDQLLPRPPIVTFLGHVDHGKTSLLDHLIGINVVSGEAGGITQHIRAYKVDKDGRSVTFVDTPGHAAFTEMRARGANVTDIAVLVIAADDGIMPQTEEAISHAKAAEVPIVVALNKIDLEGVDVTRILTQLTEYQLTPSEWGGDVEVVRTSATKGIGMDELLETLLTVAELNDYRANPDRAALGVCLESQQKGDRGVVAKLIVQNGTLRVGDVIVCGSAHGRVRSMRDTLTGKAMREAGPSTPVDLYGLDEPPGAGDRFHVLDDIVQAREIAASRQEGSRNENLAGSSTKVSFERFQEMLQGGQLGSTDVPAKLNLIIRADARGSLEAIDKEISKFDHPEVQIRILQRSVGGVSLADVTLASASDAVIMAFNVMPDDAARSLADERNIEIRRYDIIYKLADDIKLLIEGRLRPEERVVELGRALVKQVFQISRVGSIAGCYVAQGTIQRGCRIRVNRDGRTIGDYALDTLRRIKDDVKEVSRGLECGIKLAGFNDIKQDDVLEAYRIEQVARKLD